jgi:nicotinamidase-related amidase
MTNSIFQQLPIPTHFDSQKVGEVWRVPYAERANQAQQWATEHQITKAATDAKRVGLLLIDVQNTFCLPEFELYVAGQSGTGAIDDNKRLCEFIYRNLGIFTKVITTMDTHVAMQIFHPYFWVNAEGEHPQPNTIIQPDEVESGKWQVNPAVAETLPYEKSYLQAYALHYARQLSERGKFPLMIWTYHGKLGGIGHALVSSIEEAVFFHSMTRKTQTQYEQKGTHPLTENYSALRPEVLKDQQNQEIATENSALIEQLLSFDAVIVAGQAKSHCVAWTVSDLLDHIQQKDPKLAQKIYLLDDCTSPVVVPSADFTEQAEKAFTRFAEAGMQRVQSTTPIGEWLKV